MAFKPSGLAYYNSHRAVFVSASCMHQDRTGGQWTIFTRRSSPCFGSRSFGSGFGRAVPFVRNAAAGERRRFRGGISVLAPHVPISDLLTRSRRRPSETAASQTGRKRFSRIHANTALFLLFFKRSSELKMLGL